MKKILCLMLLLIFIFCGCKNNVNKLHIETKQGYIVDYNIQSQEKSLIFYENKKDNILSVSINNIPKNIDFDTLNIFIDRYKMDVFKNENNQYELKSIKIIATPKNENNNEKKLDFKKVVGERLFPDTPEAKFIMKMCNPHYYFNKDNYINGEYLPNDKINPTMCLEYFMWLNEWNNHLYLAPKKMGEYYPSEYGTASFMEKTKIFFPDLNKNAFKYLPPYNNIDNGSEQYLFYDKVNNIIKPKMCGLGGVTLEPYLRHFEYIDKDTLKIILMDKSFKKSKNSHINEWEYIIKLNNDGTWCFKKISYLQNKDRFL